MPPSLYRSLIVPSVLGAFMGALAEPVGSWSVGRTLLLVVETVLVLAEVEVEVLVVVVEGMLGERLRAVMRVLTTQMGLVRRTVAEPASAPAIMDSRVESLLRRGDLEASAAFSKAERDHSYPVDLLVGGGILI